MLPALLVSLLLAGAGADVDVWRDGAADLEAVSSFDWVEPSELGEWSRRSEGRLTLEDRLRDAIEAGLGEVGVARRVGDGADVLVGFELTPPDDPPPELARAPRISRCGRLPQSASMVFGRQLDDRLLVVLVDPATEMPVWRGWASSVFRSSRSKKAARRGEPVDVDGVLRAAASAVLAELPRSGESAATAGDG